MKRSLIVFIVAALVLITTAIWFFGTETGINSVDLTHFGIIALLIAFAVFIGIKRLKSEKRGEPVEDELSKKILQKTSSLSYYLSLYWWVFMLYLKDRITLDSDEILGTGILGMAVIFALSWVFFSIKGVRND